MSSKCVTISLRTSVKEFTKIDENITSYSMSGIKTHVQIRLEQNIDLVLKSPKLKSPGQPCDEMLLTTARRYKHYKANEGRIILKDSLLCGKNYGETGSVKYYQVLTPKQLVGEVLQSLHGEFRRIPGITKTITAYRLNYYYANMTQLMRNWVMSRMQCIKESRIDTRLPRPPLQNPNEHITGSGDAIQNDLVPEKPPSDG